MAQEVHLLCERIAHLRDGTPITIRLLQPERPGEREREIAFLSTLSERTRYMRLMTPLRYLPPHMLDQFMDVDGKSRAALVATVGEGSAEHFIGLVRYAVTDDPQSAEVGITVSDAWQGRGVASQLFRSLMDYARSQGVQRFTGIVLPENAPMLALARKLGFEIRLSGQDRLMHITKAL
jgi:acetyltransferase